MKSVRYDFMTHVGHNLVLCEVMRNDFVATVKYSLVAL